MAPEGRPRPGPPDRQGSPGGLAGPGPDAPGWLSCRLWTTLGGSCGARSVVAGGLPAGSPAPPDGWAATSAPRRKHGRRRQRRHDAPARPARRLLRRRHPGRDRPRRPRSSSPARRPRPRGRVALYLLVTMVPFRRAGAGGRAAAGPIPARPPVRTVGQHGWPGRAGLDHREQHQRLRPLPGPRLGGPAALPDVRGGPGARRWPRLLPPGLGLSQAGASYSSVYGTVAG